MSYPHSGNDVVTGPDDDWAGYAFVGFGFSLFAGSGEDEIFIGERRVDAYLGAGNDEFDARTCDLPIHVHGGDGDDTICAGSSSDDILWGEANHDTLVGGTGENDTTHGGTGNNVCDGETRTDCTYDAGLTCPL